MWSSGEGGTEGEYRGVNLPLPVLSLGVCWSSRGGATLAATGVLMVHAGTITLMTLYGAGIVTLMTLMVPIL